MLVVVHRVGGQDGRQVPFAGDEDRSAHSRQTVPTQRSAKAFARGGVLMTVIPAAVSAVSKAAVNFASRSRSKNRNCRARRESERCQQYERAAAPR
jgi:hypothetical protein